MKTKTLLLSIFIISNYSFSQKNQLDSIINAYDQSSDKSQYSNKTLNFLFSKYLGGYISSIEVPSTRSVYAIVDNSDKSLSIGFVVNDLFRKKDFEFHRFQTQFSLMSKGNGKENFYTFHNDGNFVKSIGLELTQTLHLRGWILPDNNSHLNVDEYRNTKIRKKITDLVDYGLKLDAVTIHNKIAQLEVDNIIESGWYKYFHKFWFNTKFYYPFSPINYQITKESENVLVEKIDFDNWSVTFSGNYFRQSKKFGAYLFTLKGGLSNNNNIIQEEITTQDFYSFMNSTNMITAGTKKEYYVGNYREFTSFNFGAGLSSLFLFDKSIGFSAKFETNFDSNKNPINWTLGIPFALRGKDSETPVSFELQWKEINKKHLLGISVGLTFGEKK